MNLELNSDQQEYLKTLKGKKKKRKFILDCIIEQVESKRKSVKISELPQVEIPKDKDFILVPLGYMTPSDEEFKIMLENAKKEAEINDKKKEMIKLVEDMIKNSNITIFPIYSSM